MKTSKVFVLIDSYTLLEYYHDSDQGNKLGCLEKLKLAQLYFEFKAHFNQIIADIVGIVVYMTGRPYNVKQ